MKKEFDSNELLRYLTFPIQWWLTDVELSILNDDTTSIVIDEVNMPEYVNWAYKYELNDLPIWLYTCYLTSVVWWITVMFWLEITAPWYSWSLSTDEYDKLSHAEIWARKAATQKFK